MPFRPSRAIGPNGRRDKDHGLHYHRLLARLNSVPSRHNPGRRQRTNPATFSGWPARIMTDTAHTSTTLETAATRKAFQISRSGPLHIASSRNQPNRKRCPAMATANLGIALYALVIISALKVQAQRLPSETGASGKRLSRPPSAGHDHPQQKHAQDQAGEHGAEDAYLSVWSGPAKNDRRQDD